mgnify:CR=1 FL=1
MSDQNECFAVLLHFACFVASAITCSFVVIAAFLIALFPLFDYVFRDF